MRKRTWSMTGVAVVVGMTSLGERGTAQDPKPDEVSLGITVEPVRPASIFSEPSPPAIQRPFFGQSSSSIESILPQSTPPESPKQPSPPTELEEVPVELKPSPQTRIDQQTKQGR